MGRWRQLGSGLARGLVLAVLGVVLLLVAVLGILQTGWARNQIRKVIVTQANRYLTATLEIGGLNGSLFRGIVLDDIRLSRGAETLIAIERVSVSYNIRELVDGGTLIRHLSLTRPNILVAKEADGRWNLSALVRRADNRKAGPGRPIRIDHIDLVDASIAIRDPLSFGAAHVPASFTHFSTTLAFSYSPGNWLLDFEHASFDGADPELTVEQLTGVVGIGDAGWTFKALHVVTPLSEFSLDERINSRQTPSTIDLNVAAPRFAFQEWSGVLRGLRNIAINSAFDARLSGRPTAMATTIALRSDGGDVSGDLVIDTSVPGWHAKGRADVRRLDLARWLNRPERPSDISGVVNLNLDLQLGGHFPRGTFAFKGSHAAYLDYEADDVAARGTITATDVRIATATATAYGANVRLANSTLAIDEPYAFRFVGTAAGVDLRQVPRTVPVPRVESTLAFDYDVTGRFTRPFIRGNATFADSVFLGARLGAGATGTIDTEADPFHYGGEGDIADVDLNHFGDHLQIAWLTDPRYAGTVRGRFHVDGAGSDLATMQLRGGGRMEEADLFKGRLSSADVSVNVTDGSLEGTFEGNLTDIDPSIPMADPLYAARLTGQARGRISVRDLLVRSPELDDYVVDAALVADASEVRGIEVANGTVQATMADGTMHIERLVTSGPGVDLEASGTLEVGGVRSSRIEYRVTRSDLSRLTAVFGREMNGEAVTSGVLTGPLDTMRFQGEGTLTRFAMSGVEALTTTASYDATVPVDEPLNSKAEVKARLSFVKAFGQELESVDGNATYDAGRVTARLDSALGNGTTASLDGAFVVDLDAKSVDVDALAVTALRSSWRLAPGSRPRLTWTDTELGVVALDLVDARTGQQHLTASGNWAQDGSGELSFVARDVSIDALMPEEGAPARYGGVLNATATLSGTSEDPRASVDFTIVRGHIRRLPYEKFAGHADYRSEVFQVEVRLDQAPGVWLTGAGALPLGAFDRTRPQQPINVIVKSSPISLTLLEGVTEVVRNVSGEMQLDVTVLGTSSDPHFSGRVNLTNAAFDVVSSGARYKNGRVALQLASDRVGVETLHLEDEDGHPLDVTGSLGTHELRVGDLQVAVNARHFQVIRNEYGRVDIDASMNLTGEFESPRLTGRLTVAGGSLNVDRILDRTMFQPYSTEAAATPSLDPIVAINPWDRLGIDLEVHVPGTLRMVGDNVQVSPGTPLGLGNISLRAFGDLYLYKDPKQPMYVTGSFDSVSGTYAFQGRRFDLDPSSSINFRGDLNPELYVTVTRVISGVETRVSIVGPLEEPELRLASTPALDPSDILSLIVFNTSSNELSALQQEQLAVRAGTLAAGFLAAPMMSALERTLGIDTLEIEPGTNSGSGARVTVGNEIAPGLVARFSRQFGDADYDEATVEYYLSRLFRIRATFSDAGSLTSRSAFRRVERAGIDLLLFFSF